MAFTSGRDGGAGMSERTRSRWCRGLTEGGRESELADGLIGERGDGLGVGQVDRWIARACVSGEVWAAHCSPASGCSWRRTSAGFIHRAARAGEKPWVRKAAADRAAVGGGFLPGCIAPL